jgi:hypothetical protein
MLKHFMGETFSAIKFHLLNITSVLAICICKLILYCLIGTIGYFYLYFHLQNKYGTVYLSWIGLFQIMEALRKLPIYMTFSE